MPSPFNDLDYMGNGDAVLRPPLPARNLTNEEADAYEAATAGCIDAAIASGVYEEQLS